MADRHLSRLERAALHWIPAHWRDAVAHDLAEERPPRRGAAWLVVHALIIGARLRLAQFGDGARERSSRQTAHFGLTSRTPTRGLS